MCVQGNNVFVEQVYMCCIHSLFTLDHCTCGMCLYTDQLVVSSPLMSALSLEWMLSTSQVCTVTITHSDHNYHNMKHEVIRGSDHNYHDYHNMKWLEATHCIQLWFTHCSQVRRQVRRQVIPSLIYQQQWQSWSVSSELTHTLTATNYAMHQ